jgi:hypothetical protein
VSLEQLHVGFFTALGMSVVLLVATFVTAKLHKVKAHIATVGVLLVALVTTIYFAGAMGPHYVFEPTSRGIHLPLAFLATAALIAPLATGFLHWRGRVGVKAHKIAVGVWGVALVLALGTGGWMLSAATPVKDLERGAPAASPAATPVGTPAATPTPSPN